MGIGTVIDAETTEGQRQLVQFQAMMKGLQRLQEPFTETEKLPKPMWKGAWNDERKGRCEECGGYHCLVNTIHLDYVGHAEVTRRLLEVDPWWDWEPLAWTPEGLPKFDSFGGLWINLTVCGVTRKGYGDATGKEPGTTAVKEIIGDAIRNAAMRFGVALDLWSKLDRHEGKNPGATYGNDNWQTQNARQSQPRGNGRPQESVHHGQSASQAAPPRRANQDALDALQSVCDEHGYSTQYCIDRFWSDYDIELKNAASELILVFADTLVAEATAEPDGAADADAAVDGGPDGGVPAAGEDAGVEQPVPASDTPADSAGDDGGAESGGSEADSGTATQEGIEF